MMESVEQNRGVLARLQIEEGGRLWKFADAEVGGALASISHYYGELSRADGAFARSQMKDKLSITIREPYGVILGITPWNSSLVLPSRKIFAALAGGNAIVLKDSSQMALALSFFVYLFQRAIQDVMGEDRASKAAGILQLLHGKGGTVGKTLVEKGDYEKVMFTGSHATGRFVAKVAGQKARPVSLELEGHAAIILMDDFDIDRAVTEAIAAGFGDAGQRCVALRAVYAHQKVYDEFVARLVEKTRALKVGDPAAKNTDMGPIVSSAALKEIKEAITEAKRAGAKVAYGGNALTGGYFMEPTILTSVSMRNPIMKREIFGPIISVIAFSGETREEAIFNAVKMVNSSNYGLSNAIMTIDINLAMKAMERIKTGVLYIGRGTTGAEEGRPFGGVKDSGFGREAGGLDEVTYKKQVYVDYHGKPRMANIADGEAAFKRISDAEEEFNKFKI
jgi:aldehyde dehydrogenase (NAD+)